MQDWKVGLLLKRRSPIELVKREFWRQALDEPRMITLDVILQELRFMPLSPIIFYLRDRSEGVRAACRRFVATVAVSSARRSR